MGDVAGVKAPLARRKGVQGFEGVKLRDCGGGEVLLLADWSEGLGEGDGGEQEGKRKAAKAHEGKGSKCVGELTMNRVVVGSLGAQWDAHGGGLICRCWVRRLDRALELWGRLP